jgi:hypothetical protein
MSSTYYCLQACRNALAIPADQWVFVQICSRVMREDFKSFIPEESNHEISIAQGEQR